MPASPALRGTPTAAADLAAPGFPLLDETTAAALDVLAQRHSIGPKYLADPAPDLDTLRQAAAIALRAPDHRQLRPFRFVVVPESARPQLADLFAQDAARRGHGATEVERARERAWNGPALVALVGRVRPNMEDVPDSEQWVCIGAGLMNFLNALHLMGFGAKVLSGASVRGEGIRQAFCEPGESVVAWIVAGTPRTKAMAKGADDIDGAFSVWVESQREPTQLRTAGGGSCFQSKELSPHLEPTCDHDRPKTHRE